MAEFYELEKRYEKVPQEMRQQRRWICYALRARNGKTMKIPVSPCENQNEANPSSEETWSDFDKAVEYCVNNNLDGLGFELKDSGMFAIDLDNAPDENGNQLSQKDFQNMANDFVKTLNSYTEWSVSGNGVHIFCYGKPPIVQGKNKDRIKIYDGAKYFIVTGKCIRPAGIKERSLEAKQLCDKYSSVETSNKSHEAFGDDMKELTDKQVSSAIRNSKSALKVSKLLRGDCSDYGGDKNEAKKALCKFLAFFTHCNKEQVIRLFESGKLVDDEWEGQKESFVGDAIDACAALYIKSNDNKEAPAKAVKAESTPMNVDENGEPIFRITNLKKSKSYSLDDTGNANRFYDYFGEYFHYNATDKVWMFFTGKTWVVDTKCIIRKYANQLINMLREEARQISEQLNDTADQEERKRIATVLDAYDKNVKRVSNKNGKDAMLSELQFIGKTAVENSEFNKDPYLLNTDSGIVDLRTGEIHPFNKDAMLSYNTGVKVSFEEPKTWLAFLHSIFEYPNKEDTEEVIECLRRCLGYTLTGSTKEQVIFLLHGDGSNGKSTLLNVLQAIMGDYFNTIDSSQLMVTKNQSVAIQNSLAELIGTRFLSTQETEEGARLSEPIVKHISGDEVINAQKKYGKPFYFLPVFKLWMSTNNLPIIRGKDFGIWRRIFLFPFKKQFKDAEKDKEMPEKLAAEYDKILGWCIKGAVDYLAERDLKRPSYLQDELTKYQQDLDTVLQFIGTECYTDKTKATPKRAMYDAYTAWAKRSNLPALSEPKFKNEMVKKGYALFIKQDDHGQYYDGIALGDTGLGKVPNYDKSMDPFN